MQVIARRPCMTEDKLNFLFLLILVVENYVHIVLLKIYTGARHWGKRTMGFSGVDFSSVLQTSASKRIKVE